MLSNAGRQTPRDHRQWIRMWHEYKILICTNTENPGLISNSSWLTIVTKNGHEVLDACSKKFHVFQISGSSIDCVHRSADDLVFYETLLQQSVYFWNCSGEYLPLTNITSLLPQGKQWDIDVPWLCCNRHYRSIWNSYFSSIGLYRETWFKHEHLSTGSKSYNILTVKVNTESGYFCQGVLVSYDLLIIILDTRVNLDLYQEIDIMGCCFSCAYRWPGWVGVISNVHSRQSIFWKRVMAALGTKAANWDFMIDRYWPAMTRKETVSGTKIQRQRLGWNGRL